MTTIRDALAWAIATGVDRLDAHLLLAHVLGRSRGWLLAHDDAPLDAAAAAAFDALAGRRADGEPYAYLVGEREFHGLTLRVDARVLVPRPDTETLVDWALECLAGRSAPSVVDLGTGSGAIALAVKQARPDARVSATDRSASALEVATANARRLVLDVQWLAGDWWGAVAMDARFDVVASNPPYIADGDPHLAALAHEPITALTSGRDGLDALRRIVADAALHVVPGGWLLLEHGHDQADSVRQLLDAAGFRMVQSRRDLSGIERCSGGCRPTSV